jgi:hypothetical protein
MNGTHTTAIAVLLTATACGGGGAAGDSAQDLPENSLRAAASYSAEDVDHLLVRTTFGITQADRDRAAAMGLPAFVDAMLDFPTTGTSATETAARAYLVNGTDPVGLEGKFPSTTDITDWWLYLMLRSRASVPGTPGDVLARPLRDLLDRRCAPRSAT